MNLSTPQYLAALNAASDMNLLDWISTAPNTYEHVVGKVTITVSLNPRTGSWDWKLVHERSGLLTNGSSEDQGLAQREAITYATHWVKTAMTGLLA